jgi:hypothetical protein
MTLTAHEPRTAPMPADDLMIPVGTKVEVRNRFDQHWAHGFEVAGHEGDRYQVRRMSDGTVLPVTFDEDALRKERKKSNWWY